MLFMVVGVVQMRAWAWKKELRYRKWSPGSYKAKSSALETSSCSEQQVYSSVNALVGGPNGELLRFQGSQIEY
ncbi:hypothetical protein E4T52_17392 [Aureobasidium sp. EXF-3400]|nr:hypothetical protein E4T51_02241 [Aureobasidium sp. EXF-12344]KAI4767426.1 hypothetical protein E4T52_17392 [Aureobasidium sp. EXF-3400]